MFLDEVESEKSPKENKTSNDYIGLNDEIIEIEYDWETEEESKPQTIVNLFNLKVSNTYQDLKSMNEDERAFWHLAIKKEFESEKKFSLAVCKI